MLLMTKPVCTARGCNEPRASRWKCLQHRKVYWTEAGDCSEPGCDRKAKSHGLCNGHNERRRLGVGRIGPLLPASRFGEDAPHWAGDEITYFGWHARIRAKFGTAQDQTCPCGRRAHGWAYDYSDPNPRVDEKTGLLYSLNFSKYSAMCASCHKKHDALMSATWRR